MNERSSISEAIKAKAMQLGFSACGIAPISPVHTINQSQLKQWLEKGYQADMKYMENHLDKRYDPGLLVEGSKSMVCVALNYYPAQQLRNDQLQFAYYAYGKDYHDVMKQKLTQLFTYINEHLTPITGRIFCDTAPVLERYWAQQAGLGWVGKNTQLIIPKAGSYFFLGELLLDIELNYDSPVPNHCGHCTRCLEACPSQALEQPYLLNSHKCLSYLTIEHRGKIPQSTAKAIGNKIYGCDECQHACPHNRFAKATNVPELHPTETFLSMQPDQWEHLTQENYRKIFKGSAVKRAKYEGLMRNISVTLNGQTSNEMPKKVTETK